MSLKCRWPILFGVALEIKEYLPTKIYDEVKTDDRKILNTRECLHNNPDLTIYEKGLSKSVRTLAVIKRLVFNSTENVDIKVI